MGEHNREDEEEEEQEHDNEHDACWCKLGLLVESENGAWNGSKTCSNMLLINSHAEVTFKWGDIFDGYSFESGLCAETESFVSTVNGSNLQF